MRPIARIVPIAWEVLAFPAARLGYVIAAGHAWVILTGFIGFCPMRATAGRPPLRNDLPARAEPPKGIFAEFS